MRSQKWKRISAAGDSATGRIGAIPPVKLACKAFGISQTCYRYKASLDAENVFIAARVVQLTYNYRNWDLNVPESFELDC